MEICVVLEGETQNPYVHEREIMYQRMFRRQASLRVGRREKNTTKAKAKAKSVVCVAVKPMQSVAQASASCIIINQ